METPAGMRSNSVNSRVRSYFDNAEPSRRLMPVEGVETGRARPAPTRSGEREGSRHSPDHEPGPSYERPGGESRSGTKICRPRGHPSSSLGHPSYPALSNVEVGERRPPEKSVACVNKPCRFSLRRRFFSLQPDSTGSPVRKLRPLPLLQARHPPINRPRNSV
jgi:hypothetical protein